MAWTYTDTPFIFAQNGGSPTQQTMRDTVRLLVGDTDSTDPQLTDAEVDGLLLSTSSTTSSAPAYFDPYGAAMEGCVVLAGKYSRRVDKGTGDLNISASQIAKAYMALRKSIGRQRLRFAPPTPLAAGISHSDNESNLADDDVIAPSFGVGQNDNPDISPEINTGGGFTQVVPG